MRIQRFVAPGGPAAALALAFVLAAPMLGCGKDDDGQAVQTEEMNDHLQEVTGNYGEQYAKQYGGGQ